MSRKKKVIEEVKEEEVLEGEIVEAVKERKPFTNKGMKYKLKTDKEVIETLTESRGNLALTARKLGIGTKPLTVRIRRSEVLSNLLYDLDRVELEKALNSIYAKVDDGDLNAAMFLLKNKGAELGFVNEVTLKMIGNVNHNLYDMRSLTQEELDDLERIQNKLESGNAEQVSDSG